MIYPHDAFTALLFYVLVMSFILPVVLAIPNETNNYLNDSIMNVILVSCTIMDGSYIQLFDNITTRTFVRRDRISVTAIFAALGPYYTRRAYCMNEMQFWKLYNILLKYYPKKGKKGNVTEKKRIRVQTVRFTYLYISV